MAKLEMKDARGYIASGVVRGQRIPQHIQNKIVRDYARENGFSLVMSRAEYSFEEKSYSQLFACIEDGYRHIILYSMWLMPEGENTRTNFYRKILTNRISLHFACERICVNGVEGIKSLETNLRISCAAACAGSVADLIRKQRWGGAETKPGCKMIGKTLDEDSIGQF